MYLLFLTCLGLGSQPNPETRKVERHKANYIKALFKIHWCFPVVYGLIKYKLPSLAFKILCDLVLMGLSILIFSQKCYTVPTENYLLVLEHAMLFYNTVLPLHVLLPLLRKKLHSGKI